MLLQLQHTTFLSLLLPPLSLSSVFLSPLRHFYPTKLHTTSIRLSLSSRPSAIAPRNHRRRRSADGLDDATSDETDGYDEATEEEDLVTSLSRNPRGFGAGRTYDTSVEDRLLHEIELSRKERLKNETKNRVLSKKDSTTLPKKTIDVTPTGFCVRIWNLPRKKNIQRDLQLAFKGFRGIKDINPAVSGNKKTRDPICKGFAFLDLISEDAAKRFVETYSNKSLSFGKVEKRINCCIISRNPSNSTNDTITQKPYQLQPKFDDAFMENLLREKLNKEQEEGGNLSEFEIIDCSESDSDSESEIQEDDESDVQVLLPNLEERERAVSSRKRRVRPRRKLKSSKLSLPLRLKGKERNVLTDVFSKYGRNPSVNSPMES